MQKIFGFITLGLLVLAVGKVYAQPGVGATYIGDYSKMQSKESADKEMENANWIYRLQNLKNSKFNFVVTMKDNSVRAIRSKIYVDSVNNKTYLLDAESKQKIYCNQTQKINRGDAVTGMATDSCWLFKIVSGKINAYSFLSESAGPFSLTALQTGDGPIKNFDARLLEQMIADNPKAMKPFLKKDYLKAIEKFNGDNK
ncbi:hypothetical protein BDD43_1886 [Mucilaginibacter gracilis]|uniref:Uncharacterized protein n=1 Tax=Mucilaginibacter gracilis TaxID=423350 RepID=A0A495IYE7_9SPHI|nr:hypothetical protein [Mucilaginibacter gracilis]RKR81735.1 hypothetical protein BDD43_1886 [Mucilaginibacter gracilis]